MRTSLILAFALMSLPFLLSGCTKCSSDRESRRERILEEEETTNAEEATETEIETSPESPEMIDPEGNSVDTNSTFTQKPSVNTMPGTTPPNHNNSFRMNRPPDMPQPAEDNNDTNMDSGYNEEMSPPQMEVDPEPDYEDNDEDY